jgi:hypothetical protein
MKRTVKFPGSNFSNLLQRIQGRARAVRGDRMLAFNKTK